MLAYDDDRSSLRMQVSGRLHRFPGGETAVELHAADCPCGVTNEVMSLTAGPTAAVQGALGTTPVQIHILVFVEHGNDQEVAETFLSAKEIQDRLYANSIWLSSVGPGDRMKLWRDAMTRQARNEALPQTISAEVPGYLVEVPSDTRSVQDVIQGLIDRGLEYVLSEDIRDSVRAAQDHAASIYGRLEFDRALNWMLEEVVELGQAVRRGESLGRLGEELGQVFAWVLCIGNITGIDVGSAGSTAIWREAMRQLTKYGQLRPYDASRKL